MTPKRKKIFNKLSAVVQELRDIKNLVNPEPIKIIGPEASVDKFSKFRLVLEELKSLRQQVLPDRIAYAKVLIEHKKWLTQLSAFELMEYDFQENTHSNVLEYIFSCHGNEFQGAQILSGFIGHIHTSEAEEISREVLLNSYRIERERHIGNGRIDIFICDDYNKFVIVIENKLYSPIRAINENDEDGIPITQLSNYRNYVENKYSTYKKLFILLSYLPVDGNCSSFEYCSYKDVLNSINSAGVDDPIVNQYRLLLHSIVSGITHKRRIIDRLRFMNANNDIDLNSLEIITGAFYGN